MGDTLRLEDPAGKFSLAATLLKTKRLPALEGSPGHGPLFGALLEIENTGADVYRDMPDSGAVAVPVKGWTIVSTVPQGKGVPRQPDTIAVDPGKAVKRWVWFDVAPGDRRQGAALDARLRRREGHRGVDPGGRRRVTSVLAPAWRCAARRGHPRTR